MSSSKKRRAVFLDRDGVLLEEVDHLWEIEKAKFIPGAIDALRTLQKQYVLIIITNQAGIAKGMYSESDYQRFTEWMLQQLAKSGITITGTYYCPHHPKGKVAKYRILCSCRKPEPGMLHKAERDLNILLEESWCVGDKTSDILAGERAGCKTTLLKTGYAGEDRAYDVEPDEIRQDLLRFVQGIT